MGVDNLTLLCCVGFDFSFFFLTGLVRDCIIRIDLNSVHYNSTKLFLHLGSYVRQTYISGESV